MYLGKEGREHVFYREKGERGWLMIVKMGWVNLAVESI